MSCWKINKIYLHVIESSMFKEEYRYYNIKTFSYINQSCPWTDKQLLGQRVINAWLYLLNTKPQHQTDSFSKMNSTNPGLTYAFYFFQHLYLQNLLYSGVCGQKNFLHTLRHYLRTDRSPKLCINILLILSHYICTVAQYTPFSLVLWKMLFFFCLLR